MGHSGQTSSVLNFPTKNQKETSKLEETGGQVYKTSKDVWVQETLRKYVTGKRETRVTGKETKCREYSKEKVLTGNMIK